MYLYEVSKPFPQTVEENAGLIALLTNAEEVHCMLGRIFGVSEEENWRHNHNVLYRQSGIAGSWLVQSDIPIDEEAAKKENVNFTKKAMPSGKNRKIKLIVAPYRKNGYGTRRAYIRTQEDRLAWLNLKFSDKRICNVLSCVEDHYVQTYMAHDDVTKGKGILKGFEYNIDVEILDEEAFDDVVRRGIGPSKSYGFGMVSMV